MNAKPELSVVVLTEDSGEHGRATVEALARSIFRLIVPGFGSHRIAFVPRDEREEAAMRGNVWKTDGKNPVERERQVRLRRYMARQLSLPDTFVLFHIDGDRTWADRALSENVAKFERLIRNTLPQVADRGRDIVSKTRGHDKSAVSPPVLLQLDHLLLICPFRSIEAWLYQNLTVAASICVREHGSNHIAELRAWDTRRDQLDELPAPETQLCLGKAFNRELTSGYPADAAYEIGKSFTQTVDRLMACERLVQALERTRSMESPLDFG